MELILEKKGMVGKEYHFFLAQKRPSLAHTLVLKEEFPALYFTLGNELGISDIRASPCLWGVRL